MQEFSSISVSSYEAGSLAERLTEQSRDGWSVVAIVPTGSTVTAYLSRDTDGAPVAAPAMSVDEAAEPAAEPVAEPAAEPAADITPEPAVDVTPEPVTEPDIEIAPEPAAEITPEPAAERAIEPVLPTGAGTAEPAAEIAPEPATGAEPTTEATAAAAAGAAPAGWYADPSGRFELRYWDGGQWTEHVSRAGQQYTDPPVA